VDNTSSSLPVCVYCGTARPADESLCPECGKPWIDVSVDAAAVPPPPPPPPPGTDDEPTADIPAVNPPATVAAAAATAAHAADDTGEFSFDDWTMPPERSRNPARWLIPVVLLIAVVVVWALVFLDGGDTPGTTIAIETTTTAETSTTQATTTTTAATTTTVAETTTTTVFIPPPSAWQPVGDAIPSDELTLRAEGIGPLDFGEPVAFIAGRLTASLGEAETSGTDGLCEVDEGYWLQWGDLIAIFGSFDADAPFVSYRYTDTGSDTDLGLTTLSGLALGDTVADLQAIYAQFTIAFEVIDGTDYFRLIDGGELLLWGPVSSTEASGIIEGIFSPSSCDS
jgi:hypothetical protein